jgi:phospholipid/cholesterol/gamma-HCH transport system substrate-binding protein
MTDVDLDEILSSLDADTRDHLQLLLGGAAGGLKGRGMDLAELFRRFGPTARDLRRVNEGVSVERENIKDAIHGLAQVTNELAGKDDDLARLVDSSAAVFESFASEDRNVSSTVQQLPAALQTTTRTLADVQAFADQLGPTARSLTPVFQTLDKTNRVIAPVAKQLTPVVQNQIRPFVREARPLVANLRPAARGLSAAMPDLTTVGSKVNTLFNLLAYNKNGAESPDVKDRSESYLFWLAWLTHQTENLINVDDANGPMRPIFLTGTCNTLTNLVNNEPGLEFLLGLSGLLSQQCDNPTTTSILPNVVKKRVSKEAQAFDKTRAASKALLDGNETQSALKTILGAAK